MQARVYLNAGITAALALLLSTPVYAGRNVFGVGAPAGNRDAVRAQAFAESQAQAMRIQAAARERLARSAQGLQSMQSAQAAARASAAALNNVANGLVSGGLDPLMIPNPDKPGEMKFDRWDGADAPVAAGNDVTIKQNNQQAVLHWKTFNVGRDTTVNFDQSKGGADAGKWIAFNKVFDPSAAPSQIRGRINAQGQVYVINRNGVVFGGSSQINTRTFVASTLPINDNLVRDGLLNNKDAQFIFDGIRVPAGDRPYGDIVVERGARLQATAGQDGNGGRVMLVGANVHNDGTIDTPAGQSILAAGLQVGVRAHPENDPSLRGLDVWIGQVGDYAGRVENSGLVQSSTGSIVMAGKDVKQRGVLVSTTSVNLNGRIDLLASYDALSYPGFDSAANALKPPFLSQSTGTVELAAGSLTSVLPDANGKRIPGTRLSQNSQVNIEGKAVYFGRGSILVAPSGDVAVRAGVWPEQAPDANGVLASVAPEFFDAAANQRILHSTGQVYLDQGALIDVSGSVDGLVPLSQNLLTVAMRSSELADSPLQRNSALRGVPLVVDLRETGVDNGRSWIGTPLGDLTGYLAIIERDIAQLTARGGTISISAGDSIVMRSGATVDVSGGLLTHGAGYVQTSMLSLGGRPTPVSSARADINYDGVYSGTVTVTSKWRAPRTYSSGIFNPAKGYNQNSYFEGAPAGTVSLSAPSLALAGNLVGKSYASPDQRQSPPALGSLRLAFTGEKLVKPAGKASAFLAYSPSAPEFRLASGRSSTLALPEFELVDGEPVALPGFLRGVFTLGGSVLDEDEGGFGNLSVENADGNFVVAAGTSVRLRPGGELAVSAKNIRMDGSITVPQGTVTLTAYNFSPYLYEELSAMDRLAQQPAPAVRPDRGSVLLGSRSRIDVSGMMVDDRRFSANPSFGAALTDGGDIKLEGYSVRLPSGSVLDASGGVYAGPDNDFSFGDGGSISILSGRDPNLITSDMGQLLLQGQLLAYSGSKGGSLEVSANAIFAGFDAVSLRKPLSELLRNIPREEAYRIALKALLFSDANYYPEKEGDNYVLTDAKLAGADFQNLRDDANSFATAFQTASPGLLADLILGNASATGDQSLLAVAGAIRSRIAVLEPSRFESGGFSSYSLTSVSQFGSRSVEDVGGPSKDGTLQAASLLVGGRITPKAETLALQPRAARPVVGSRQLGPDLFAPFLPGAEFSGDRQTVRLSLKAAGFEDTVETAPAEKEVKALGIVEMLAGSVIATDGPSLDGKPSVSLEGDLVRLNGSISARGGSIKIEGRSSFRLPTAEKNNDATPAYATVEVGSSARLSAAGVLRPFADLYGLRAGQLLPGGSIALSGNIVTEEGAVIDVRGASGILDFSPQRLGRPTRDAKNPFKVVLGVPAKVDSDGGVIKLEGSQMLYSDATLLGSAGGPSALGGTLSVSSGRFYAFNADERSDEINLVVRQNGLAAGFRAERKGAYDLGFFAVDRFSFGGFDNLDLGYVYGNFDSSLLPFGGNLEFGGIGANRDVAVSARGQLRVAGGGVIKANGAVSLAAAAVTLGQPYQGPLHPEDRPSPPFSQTLGSDRPALPVSPTSGSGSLQIAASHIDTGNLVLQGTSSASLVARDGDIRGYGSVNMAGDLTLQAARIYPTTLGDFDLFAYSNSESDAAGSITVLASGAAGAPLSAGGNLRLMAADIEQMGTLRAPFGRITLGWDGSGEAPVNAVTGSAAVMSSTAKLVLGSSSVTSVSSDGLVIPFGLSPNGFTWIDPRGVDVTAGGLPQRAISLSAGDVATAPGSVVDVGGGGDLLAYRWVPGIGGSSDLLGVADPDRDDWSALGTYDAGDLVSHEGSTWSARVDIDPQDFAQVPEPEEGLFWVKVPESYAVLPGFSDRSAPIGRFNTGVNSGGLAGDPGYFDPGLRVGEQVYLEGIPGLASGYHTLLPRRYALLPGAFLVIPEEGQLNGTGSIVSTKIPASRRDEFLTPELVRLEEGSYLANGRSRNGLNPAAAVDVVQSRFEVLPREVVAARAQYDIYGANQFLAASARRLDLPAVQRLPQDSSRLSIHGNTGLDLAGTVLARSTAVAGGRAAEIDVSSLAAMTITRPGAAAPAPGAVVLAVEKINSWGFESLLVGGQRSENGDGVAVDVRSPQVVLAPGGVLRGADITLAGQNTLNISSGSAMRAEGTLGGAAQNLQLGADGALVRVSTDANAAITRNEQPSTTSQKVSIGAGAVLEGAGVIVDSTYAAELDGNLDLRAGTLTLGSGQISVLLDGTAPALTGSDVTEHLVLGGDLLGRVSESDVLRLLSYRTIDLYGEGTLGSADLARLELLASGLRGYGAGAAGAVIRAGDVYLARPNAGMIDLAAPGAFAGSLSVQSSRLLLGLGQLSVRGYDNFNATAAGGVQAGAGGSLSLGSHATFNTPVLVGGQGVSYDITATGALALQRAGSSVVAPGLGARMNLQGTSVNLVSDILLPSGVLSVTATTGNIDVSGRLATDGQARQFFDVTRYTDGGSIDLTARQGSVRLLSGSDVSVAAHTGGGDAGYLNVRSPGGVFDIGGALDGSAGAGRTSGSFTLDAGSVADFDALRTDLDNAGFFQLRNFRVRTDDVTVAGTTRVRDYSLSVDAGNISVTGTIDASGETGGSIRLAASGSVTVDSLPVLSTTASEVEETTVSASGISPLSGDYFLRVTTGSASGAWERVKSSSSGVLTIEKTIAGFTKNDSFEIKPVSLTVAAEKFSNAGKGGHIALEAGSAINGVADTSALLDLRAGSLVDLSVVDYEGGSYITPGSSAFYGQFEGTLHLRAPQNEAGNDLQIAPLLGQIRGGSSILAEGFRVYNLDATSGQITSSGSINELGGAMSSPMNVQGSIRQMGQNFLGAGYENMVDRLIGAGDPRNLGAKLVVAPGAEISKANGNIELGTPTSNTTADWDLSTFRFGPKEAPGVLTLRAAGDLVFHNTLSDGFAPTLSSPDRSWLWLAPLMSVAVDEEGKLLLPVNTQSWSYRLTSGADLSSAGHHVTRDLSGLSPNSGSVLVGKDNAPSSASGGANATTASVIRSGNGFFQVIRTGTGSIDLSAARDVQLRNPFATIYTAGVGLVDPTAVYQAGDFSLPITQLTRNPPQGNLGAIQQSYAAYFPLAGGDVRIAAGQDIGRYTTLNGQLVADASMQLPTHWLYRRGLVDPATGLFGRVTYNWREGIANRSLTDPSASTAWWVDYSNFFQGFGALGGGDVRLAAGRDLVNADAAIPTSARMAGQDASSGSSAATRRNLAPDAANLLEHGGGDLLVRAGRNIDGGIFYVERGEGTLRALDEITTNEARSPNPWRFTSQETLLDASMWQAVTLFGGRTQFDVAARGDVLLGPATSAFMLPQGLNNKFWYKTQFQTVDPASGLSAASIGGAITHRLFVSGVRSADSPQSVLNVTYRKLFSVAPDSAAWYRPWLRLSENAAERNFITAATIGLPSLKSTAFGGDVTVVGHLNLFPSPQGELELLASGSLPGLAVAGVSASERQWISTRLNLSDADPARMPDAISPIGNQVVSTTTSSDTWTFASALFGESGSYKGVYATTEVKSALHAATPVHAGNPNPVRLYAGGGNLSGLTLFAPKKIRAVAAQDITDIAFYLQHTGSSDISLVSAGRDLIPYNENAPMRVRGNSAGNVILDAEFDTVVPLDDRNFVKKQALAGDIQIGGQGIMQALAGRDIDFGSGANFRDGTGVGFTSIGRLRNPSLPFEGAHYLVMAGVGGSSHGTATGLSESSLTFSDYPYGGFFDAGFLAVASSSSDGEDGLFVVPPENQKPSDLVGLQSYDRILSANGSEVEDLESLKTILKGASQTEDVELLVRRANKTEIEASIRDLRGLVEISVAAISGSTPAEKAFYVDSVPSGSQAERLGLRSGDFITPGSKEGNLFIYRGNKTVSSVVLTADHRAAGSMMELFHKLEKIGKDAAQDGNYAPGYKAVESIFAKNLASGNLLTRARDLRTTSGGSIIAAAPGGGIAMASDIFGNPLTPPGIVTEYGGEVSVLTKGNLDIGRARIFTLRGGDLTIWSSRGDIAAGTAAKTVVTAPPTRVLIDAISAEIETDLGGLATGGGIGVLASVAGVEPGAVTLLAPRGTVDAGDAGIRATGNITIAAAQVRNADNIAAGGASVGVPAAPAAAAPNVAGLSSASSSSAATSQAASDVTRQAQSGPAAEQQMVPSNITVEVLGYGGGGAEEEERQEANVGAPAEEQVL